MRDRRAEFGNINENERNGGIYCGRSVAAKQLIFTNFDILLTQPKPGPLLAKKGDGMETTRALHALAYPRWPGPTGSARLVTMTLGWSICSSLGSETARKEERRGEGD